MSWCVCLVVVVACAVLSVVRFEGRSARDGTREGGVTHTERGYLGGVRE